MPCCGNVRVKVWSRRKEDPYVSWAKDYRWDYDGGGGDVIVYQMLGEKE